MCVCVCVRDYLQASSYILMRPKQKNPVQFRTPLLCALVWRLYHYFQAYTFWTGFWQDSPLECMYSVNSWCNASLCIFEFLWMLKWSSVAVIWLQLEWFALTKCNWIHKCNLNTICYNWFCPDEQTAFKIDMEDRYCLLGFHEIDSFICLFIFISWLHIWEMWKGGGVCGPGDGVFVLATLYRHCCCGASPARNGDVKGCLMTVQIPVDLRVKCCCEVRLYPCVMTVDRFSAQFFNLLRADEMGNTRFWVDTVWENSLGLWKLPRLSLILNFEMPCSVSNFRFWC